MEPNAIADAFVRRYERFWHDGATEVSRVYTPDAILCGYEIVRSTNGVGKLLGTIYRQGWKRIGIEIAEAASINGTILLACRYTASNGTDERSAKSSYVLIESDGTWKAAMHTTG